VINCTRTVICMAMVDGKDQMQGEYSNHIVHRAGTLNNFLFFITRILFYSMVFFNSHYRKLLNLRGHVVHLCSLYSKFILYQLHYPTLFYFQ
jgi:hypothetical protein